MKKTKIFLIILVILLLVPVVATVFLNQSDTKNLIRTYIQSQTGRELTIDGRLAAKWGLSPTIYAENIMLSNSDWAQTPYAFKAEKLTISLSFMELIRGQFKVKAIELDRPQLWIEQNPQSKLFNPDLRASKRNNEKRSSQRLLSDRIEIEELAINNGSIQYLHEQRTWDIEIHNAKLESSGNNRPTYLQALGELEKTTLSVSGELGSVNSVLAYREIPVELTGYLGDRKNNFSISGVIQDLIRWQGLNLWLEANISNLTDLTNLLGFQVLPYRDISAKGELIQPGSVETMRLESIQLQSSDLGLSAYAEGEIGLLSTMSEVEIVFGASGNLDNNLIPLELSKKAILETSITGKLSGGKDNLVLNLEHGEVLTQGVSFYANGVVNHVSEDWSSSLLVSMNIDSLDSVGKLLNLDLPESGEIRAKANLGRYAKDLYLSDITISSDTDALEFNANGRMDNLGENTIGELNFDLKANQGFLSKITESKLLKLFDEVSVDGIFRVENAVARLTDLNIDGLGQGLKLEGSGSVKDVARGQGLNLDLQLEIESLSSINSIVEQKLPVSGPMKLVGSLVSNEAGEVNIKDLSGKLQDPNLSIELNGDVFGLTATPKVNLDIVMELRSLGPLNEMYPQAGFTNFLLPLLPVKGRAYLSGDRNNRLKPGYSLENIYIESLSNRINGEVVGSIHNLFVDDSAESPDIEGRLSFSLNGALDGSPIDLSAITSFQPSVFNGEIDGDMDIMMSQGNIGLDIAKLNINSSDKVLHLSGSIDKLSPFQSKGLKLEFDIASLDDVFKLSGIPLKGNNPTKGVINLTTIDANQNVKFEVEVGNSDLKGDVIIVNSNSTDSQNHSPDYDAKLLSRNFDLTQLLVKDEKSVSFFSQEPITLVWLDKINAKIEFSADKFTHPSLTLNKFESLTSLSHQQLLTKVSGVKGQGKINIELSLNKLNQGVNARLGISGQGIDLSALTKLGKTESDNAGNFTIDIALSGNGNSVSNILGNASGSALLELGGAKIKNDGLEILGGDLFVGLFNTINPLSKKDDYLDIECGVIKLDIENGIAKTKNGLALKTSSVTLLGGGDINLGNEELKVFIRPKARKGFGINTNSIAKLIRIGGTLNKPKVEADPKGLFQTGVALGAALASGGLSLFAQGLYDKLQANSDVCNIAANRIPVDSGNNIEVDTVK